MVTYNPFDNIKNGGFIPARQSFGDDFNPTTKGQPNMNEWNELKGAVDRVLSNGDCVLTVFYNKAPQHYKNINNITSYTVGEYELIIHIRRRDMTNPVCNYLLSGDDVIVKMELLEYQWSQTEGETIRTKKFLSPTHNMYLQCINKERELGRAGDCWGRSQWDEDPLSRKRHVGRLADRDVFVDESKEPVQSMLEKHCRATMDRDLEERLNSRTTMIKCEEFENENKKHDKNIRNLFYKRYGRNKNKS